MFVNLGVLPNQIDRTALGGLFCPSIGGGAITTWKLLVGSENRWDPATKLDSNRVLDNHRDGTMAGHQHLFETDQFLGYSFRSTRSFHQNGTS